MASYPSSTLRPRWWETASAVARPYLKSNGKTLADLTTTLDEYLAVGIDTIEVFAPCAGGTCYNGLDTLDFYEIDLAIGVMADLENLIEAAHQRHMAVILFINLGYGHEQFPAFLKACDDVRAGLDSPEVRMFCWSETGKDRMDRSLAPYFLNDTHGNWRWSERAQKYFWVKWEGEQGGYHLPQFNFGDPGWQQETRRIIDFWLKTGIDGMVIDAVNWYVDCSWEITRFSMTDLLNQADNQFSQPEGAGGFGDDPVPWIIQGGFNCIMDYDIKKWWEGRDLLRQAILSSDPRPIETSLCRYRDRVAAAGGICYIDPPNLNDQPVAARLLGAAAAATMGELLILIDDQLEEENEEYWSGLTGLLLARQHHPALCAAAARQRLSTHDDARFYAFLRKHANEQLLILLNFQDDPYDVQVYLHDGSRPEKLIDILSQEEIAVGSGPAVISMPAFGYKILRFQN
jgi:glycosidase